MVSTEEEIPLLNNHQEVNQRENKFTLILGGCAGLLSSLVFACNNLAVKSWQLDFTDVLLVRSTVQVISFGIAGKCFKQRFWPEKDASASLKSYYFEVFLLLFQVSTRSIKRLLNFNGSHLICSI